MDLAQTVKIIPLKILHHIKRGSTMSAILKKYFAKGSLLVNLQNFGPQNFVAIHVQLFLPVFT